MLPSYVDAARSRRRALIPEARQVRGLLREDPKCGLRVNYVTVGVIQHEGREGFLQGVTSRMLQPPDSRPPAET